MPTTPTPERPICWLRGLQYAHPWICSPARWHERDNERRALALRHGEWLGVGS